ncbi:MAG TPA: hypothetical protein VK066_08705 [Chloroflexota bacterium]|nr:hypothetical protein [Chloroflexota bacterium]
MSTERSDPLDTLEPLKRAVRARFPEAEFDYREAPDGLRAYLDVFTDCTDDFAVLECVEGITLDLYLQRGVLVHVFPFRRRSG